MGKVEKEQVSNDILTQRFSRRALLASLVGSGLVLGGGVKIALAGGGCENTGDYWRTTADDCPGPIMQQKTINTESINVIAVGVGVGTGVAVAVTETLHRRLR